jgi:hypothetical protein
MSDYYYGKLGNTEWTLLADKRIVVWTKSSSEFTAFDSISEADEHFANPSEAAAYFWDNGQWNGVNFFLEKGKATTVTGFAPSRASK